MTPSPVPEDVPALGWRELPLPQGSPRSVTAHQALETPLHGDRYLMQGEDLPPYSTEKKPWKEILGHLSLKAQNRGRLDYVYCKTELLGGSWRQIASHRALESHLVYF